MKISFKNHIGIGLHQNSHYTTFGSPMPGRQFTSSSGYRYGFNGQEKDDEIVGSGNSYDFGARIYDSRLGRWLSVDPLSNKAPGVTPYRFGFNNPIKFIDRDGLWEFEVRTDKNGQKTVVLVAEKGDNIKTLAEQTGISVHKLVKDYTVEIKSPDGKGTIMIDISENWSEGSELISIGNQFSFEGINNGLNESNTTDCNCWGSAVSMGRHKSINAKNGIPSPVNADNILQNEFTETNSPKIGDIVRYAVPAGYSGVDINENGIVDYNNETERKAGGYASKGSSVGGTSHFATFLLKNDKGTQVFTKNGWKNEWKIQYEKDLPNSYGGQTGIKGGSPTFTKKK